MERELECGEICDKANTEKKIEARWRVSGVHCTISVFPFKIGHNKMLKKQVKNVNQNIKTIGDV